MRSGNNIGCPLLVMNSSAAALEFEAENDLPTQLVSEQLFSV